MSESAEAKLREELFLLWERNRGERNKTKRILKRFLECING